MSGREPDPRILEVFREEAAERLDRMVETLLSLESGQPPGAIDALFRDAHSLKGSAGMVGIEDARVIADAIEEILADARKRAKFDRNLVDPLLRATDALRRAIAGEAGIAAAAVNDLAERPALADGGGARSTASVARSAPSRTNGQRLIRTSADKVDRLMDSVGETVLHSRRLAHLLGGAEGAERGVERIDEELARGEVLLDALQDSVIQMRTLPLSSITGQFPRAVRDLAVARGCEVELHISGADTPLDRMILEGISETLTHLLRNAVAHGIEPPDERLAAGKPARGRIELRAEQRGSLVAIEVHDDGRGVAPELVGKAGEGRALADVLAEAGFSTATEVTDISGRGVGLDAVKSNVESLGGSLAMRSEPGRGTTVTLTLPVTLALLRVLLLERADQTFGVPLTSVEEVITVTNAVALGGREAIELRERPIPIADLAQLIGAAAPAVRVTPPAVVVGSSGRRVAVVCDRIVEEQEVVMKGLGPLLHAVAGYLGAAILGDGGVVLILDPAFLSKLLPRGAKPAVSPEQRGPSKLLVVDDQFTVRELQRSILQAAGYRVETARDGREALLRLTGEPDIELVVTDIEMPEMDGIELLRQVRADAKHSSLPIIVVTARGGDEDRRRGLEAGADAYIVKEQFDQDTLLDTVGRLLTR
jgi:two-component system chemotaxis sensor kinase CheA